MRSPSKPSQMTTLDRKATLELYGGGMDGVTRFLVLLGYALEAEQNRNKEAKKLADEILGPE